MRILVLPKNLEVGGTQVNAVDIAVELAARGHDVHVASADGPLGIRLDEHGIPRHGLPDPGERARRLSTIAGAIRRVQPDILHAYEVRSIFDACLGGSPVSRSPVLGSILSTRVPWFLPESLRLTVGLPSLAAFTARWRRGPTILIEPPVAPVAITGSHDALPGLAELDGGDRLVVLVSRLVDPFKREGILRTISAMHLLGREGYRLLIVGDGPARPAFEHAAAATNQALGRRVIAFAGMLLDPSPAFAAADVVVGNGTSIIRGVMAGKPGVVVGREGFSRVVTSEGIEALAEAGFYGVGGGVVGDDPLADQIRDATATTGSPAVASLAVAMAARYGHAAVTDRMEAELRHAGASPPPTTSELARALGRAVHYRTARRRLTIEARRTGLTGENASNFVYGTLRNMALPPARPGTGRNLG